MNHKSLLKETKCIFKYINIKKLKLPKLVVEIQLQKRKKFVRKAKGSLFA